MKIPKDETFLQELRRVYPHLPEGLAEIIDFALGLEPSLFDLASQTIDTLYGFQSRYIGWKNHEWNRTQQKIKACKAQYKSGRGGDIPEHTAISMLEEDFRAKVLVKKKEIDVLWKWFEQSMVNIVDNHIAMQEQVNHTKYLIRKYNGIKQ